MGIEALMLLLSLAGAAASIGQQVSQKKASEEADAYRRQQVSQQNARNKKADLLGRQSKFRQSLVSRMKQNPIMAQSPYGLESQKITIGPDEANLLPWQALGAGAGVGQDVVKFLGSQPRFVKSAPVTSVA